MNWPYIGPAKIGLRRRNFSKSNLILWNPILPAIQLRQHPVSFLPLALQDQAGERGRVDRAGPMEPAALPLGFGNARIAQVLFRHFDQVGGLKMQAFACISGVWKGIGHAPKTTNPAEKLS